MLYVAFVYHQTPHGRELTKMCSVDGDPRRALAAAKHPDWYGYVFRENGTGTMVLAVDPIQVARLSSLDAHPPSGTDYPIIFARLLSNDTWVEYWGDPELEQQFRDDPLDQERN